MSKKITSCPGWLTLSPDRTSFILSVERAQLVRSVFEWSIAGLGAYTIAKRLDAIGAPTFGSSKQWDPSTITKLLGNRATLGELHPVQNGKNQPGELIRDYYPRVIDEQIFLAAREASRRNLLSGRGRKGRLLTNLFANISTCYYCGAQMKFHSNGDSKSLICSTAFRLQKCERTAWSYADFEETFLKFCEVSNALPELVTLIAQMKAMISAHDTVQSREVRLDLAILLKKNIARLALATSGSPVEIKRQSGLIRRNLPQRFFELQFEQGSVSTVYPTPFEKEPGPKINWNFIAKALGISPRQAEITALLVEGLTLAESAVRLSMTTATARWHLREAFRRTNTHSQSALVEYAIKAGQGDLDPKDIELTIIEHVTN